MVEKGMKSTRITIREDLLKKAEDCIEQGCFPGIRSVSGLVEKALTELLKEFEIPQR